MVRRQVEVYADRAGDAAGGSGWSCGSGYLLGGRLVLTAAHVVCPTGDPAAVVRVLVEGAGQLAGRVVWHRHDHSDSGGGGVDVALVVITDAGWVPPGWRHRPRWGRLVTSRPGQRCAAVGFPAVVATPARRDTFHAVGVVNPGALDKAGLYAVEVTNPPDGPGVDGSRWQGMSGAAVTCRSVHGGEVLIGVVAQDPAGFDSRRLTAVPITTVATDPEFVRLVTEHTGAAMVIEPVELAGLELPVQPAESPAGLLRADVAETPFRPRPELSALQQWCRDGAWSGVRLIAGPGGQGKTRLARQLATDMQVEGWSTVLLADTATPEQVAVLGEVSGPVLVVVDYAEGRTHQLTAVLAALGAAEARVRLLLLARTAGAWRTDRVDPHPQLAVLGDDRIVVDLGPVEPAPAGRGDAWRQAVVAVAAGLGDLDGYRHLDWAAVAAGLVVPALSGDRFRTILAVHTDALAALLQTADPVTDAGGRADGGADGGAGGGAGGAGVVLLEHESRYWSRVADRFGVTLIAATRRRLVAAATLWGAADPGQAHRVLDCVVPRIDGDSRANVADWLATLYRDGERYWSGLTPDPLAETLIAATLAGPYPGLISDTVGAVEGGQLEHGLTVLGRAHPQYPHLAVAITDTIVAAGAAGAVAAIAVAPRVAQPQPLLDALALLAPTLDLPDLQTVDQALPRYSVLLARATVEVATVLTSAGGMPSPPTGPRTCPTWPDR